MGTPSPRKLTDTSAGVLGDLRGSAVNIAQNWLATLLENAQTVVEFSLVALVALFVALFLLPAFVQWWKLWRISRRVRRVDRDDLTSLSGVFKRDGVLSHLWDEFRHTLHEQKVPDGAGSYRRVAIRQTIPAEAYFSDQALVHTPLRSEFFKHLPGILTGLGIIGTFAGLINGLRSFNVSDDPGLVRQSLDLLVQGVYSAFSVSAAAITAAMIVTFLEKWLISGLQRKVEGLCRELDRRFDSGAVEEYLSRLVTASESSASEARILKQSLVNDLKAILETLTERQIESHNAATLVMTQSITSAVSESLQQPLTQISSAVQHVSGSQGDAVNRLLTDTMAAFTAQIRDLFSGQVEGIRGMQQQTIESLASTVSRLEDLVSQIARRGQETTDSIASELKSTITEIGRRQEELNQETRSFIEVLRSQVVRAQDDLTTRAEDALGRIAAVVGDVGTTLKLRIDEGFERDAVRTEKIASLTGEIAQETRLAVSAMSEAVGRMGAGTSDTVRQMTVGASDMRNAAAEMIRVATTGREVVERAERLVGALSATAAATMDATSALRGTAELYSTTKEALRAMVTDLRAATDNARREAALTSDILERIEQTTHGLVAAQTQLDSYLAGVSKVLGDAHQEFGSQIVSTLTTLNGEFHKHVERGAKALAGAIDELDQVLDRVNRQ